MKKLSFVLVLAILLAGGTVAAMSAPSYAQVYEYPPPLADPYAQPWVGSNTPWVYYNGDWFLNGILYYFFGPQYGWAPYYAYPPTYIERPGNWYAPRWLAWYQGNPHYWEHFQQAYPYWRGHRQDQRYDQKFFEQHHRDQGGGWQKGFQGRPSAPARPEGQRPGPAQVAPPAGQRPAGPTRVTPPEGQRPAPAVTPSEGQRPGPAQVAPPAGQRPAGPTRVTPPEGQRPAPAVAPPAGQRPAPAVTTPEGQRPAPARVAPPEGQKGGAAGREKVPEGKPGTTAPGEEKK